MQQNMAPEDALALILERVEQAVEQAAPASRRDAEAVPLPEALGRVLAHDVAAPLDLPPFDNSAVDGYAVRSRDTEAASLHSIATFPCQSTIAAAPLRDEEALRPGTCARIMTGAPLPDGADSVAMREDVDESDSGLIRFSASTCEGQNVRLRGEDIGRGEVAVSGGTRLRASEIALLAACGLSSVDVAPRPRIGIITTGDELAEPGQALQPGQIYNSNSFALDALCRECGAQIVLSKHAGDDARALAQTMLEAAANCDVLLTSGGVSAGDFDPVRDVLLGAEGLPAIARAHFWKASIKPGRPILFATLQHEGREVPVFALPGNPVSVAVTFEIFVRPALLLLQGIGVEAAQRRSIVAHVNCEGDSPLGKTEYVRAFVSRNAGASTWRAQVTGAQGSGRLTTMARANALLVIPPSVARYKAGDEFEARLLD